MHEPIYDYPLMARAIMEAIPDIMSDHGFFVHTDIDYISAIKGRVIIIAVLARSKSSIIFIMRMISDDTHEHHVERNEFCYNYSDLDPVLMMNEICGYVTLICQNYESILGCGSVDDFGGV